MAPLTPPPGGGRESMTHRFLEWAVVYSRTRATGMGKPRWNRLGQNGRDMLQMYSALFLLLSRAPAWSTHNR